MKTLTFCFLGDCCASSEELKCESWYKTISICLPHFTFHNAHGLCCLLLAGILVFFCTRKNQLKETFRCIYALDQSYYLVVLCLLLLNPLKNKQTNTQATNSVNVTVLPVMVEYVCDQYFLWILFNGKAEEILTIRASLHAKHHCLGPFPVISLPGSTFCD